MNHLQEGEELTLSDVCIKVEKLPIILSEKVVENYADEYETFFGNIT